MSFFLDVFSFGVRCINLFKSYFLWRPNYKILKAELDYLHVPVEAEDELEDELDPVFRGETKYWDEDRDVWSWVDITKYAKEGTVGDIIIPMSVENCVVSLWYTFNDKCYKFFTRDLEYVWPPQDSRDPAKFVLPIRSAELLDGEMEVIRDVTGKIKKYAGPYYNFFYQDILPDDLFQSRDFKFLKIVNILGQEVVFPHDDLIQVPW